MDRITTGVNISKGGIYALVLWLVLNWNDTSNNQSRHLVGPTEMQLTIHENRQPNITRCTGQCLAYSIFAAKLGNLTVLHLSNQTMPGALNI